MTFELTIPDDMMQEMQLQSGIYDRTELCQEMVAIYQWVLQETWEGKEILSEDSVRQKQTRITTTAIENIERRRQNFAYGQK
ncbi:hypothetical protein [Chitinophaga caseinilytica]|uniref:CopG family transcriptional regulator n=1 Tax=Chitinophaga caseinilytica TaxID=2267521 RepID=A0ABZ2YXI0_9BACT